MIVDNTVDNTVVFTLNEIIFRLVKIFEFIQRF